MFEAEAGKRGAAPGILDAGPGQGRIEIVATVHEPGAGFDALPHRQRYRAIAGEHRGAQAIRAVVHQADRLLVVGHRHHAANRSEALVGHDPHAVVYVDQDLRRHIRRRRRIRGEAARIDQAARAFGYGFGDDGADIGGGGSSHHRTERRQRVERIAQHILPGQGHRPLDEFVIYRLVRIDALDAAAGLTRVEESAIHQGFHGMRQIGVGAHIARIVAAQFQPDADKTSGGRLLHRHAAGHGTGETDEIHFRRADHALGRFVRGMQVLKHALGKTGGTESFGKPLGHQRRLGRVLEQHDVAGQQRRHDGIDRRQQRIIPRRDHQHDTHRVAPYEARETIDRRRNHIGQ